MLIFCTSLSREHGTNLLPMLTSIVEVRAKGAIHYAPRMSNLKGNYKILLTHHFQLTSRILSPLHIAKCCRIASRMSP